jgi:hypothetical protein
VTDRSVSRIVQLDFFCAQSRGGNPQRRSASRCVTELAERLARIPFNVPYAQDLPARVSGVLTVLYLVFNEGYLATGSNTDALRDGLTLEAIRLTRVVRKRRRIPKGPSFTRDGSKNIEMSFRPWDGQMRMPITLSWTH